MGKSVHWHCCRIMHALQTYAPEAEAEVSRWERNFAKLAPALQVLPPQPAVASKLGVLLLVFNLHPLILLLPCRLWCQSSA